MTRDPFACDGPTLINVSGGRSSMYMLRRTLDAHGGRLPREAHAVFTNTGRERAETLAFVAECAATWGVAIVWLERDGSQPSGARFRETDYEHASRNGEPFAELIAERKYVPNAVTRFCTSALKIDVARDWMRARGYERWTSVLGLRRDEPSRVARVRGREDAGWDVACPLYDARITKADVTAWWARQVFNLALEPWQSNCDLCPLKRRAELERAIRDDDSVADWWIAMERAVGATFRKDEPRGYEGMRERVRRLPMLAFASSDDEAVTPCNCTDRVRRRRCTCGKRRGEGHALACGMVLGRAA